MFFGPPHLSSEAVDERAAFDKDRADDLSGPGLDAKYTIAHAMSKKAERSAAHLGYLFIRVFL